MWTRAELKSRGKHSYYKNHWSCVPITFFMDISLLKTKTRSSISGGNSHHASFETSGDFMMIISGMLISLFVFVVIIAAVCVKIFIGNVLLVGGYNFFIRNQSENPSIRTILSGFASGHYVNIALTMFLRDLYTFLWSLLFVIPGIIKSYEYRMVPYILAENPGMNSQDAFMISRRMMMGQKFDVFVLDLSFIGWHILSAISFGLAGIFFVQPYYQSVFAQLYSVNKIKAYEQGFIR